MGRKHCGKRRNCSLRQCFQKASYPGASKGAIVWEWVHINNRWQIKWGWKDATCLKNDRKGCRKIRKCCLLTFSLLLPQCFQKPSLPRFLTHYHTIPHFDALKIYSCGKQCEKRKNCLWQAISPSTTMFSNLYGTYFPFLMHFKMSSAICFNLDKSKICHLVMG